MATTHTIFRRKPATYGKTSSKSLRHQFGSSAFDHATPTIDVLAPQSGLTVPKTTNNDGFLPSHDVGRISQQAIPTIELKETQAGFGYSPSRSERNSIARTVTGSATRETRSSDNEQPGVQSTLTRARKRRKIISSQVGDSARKNVSRAVRLIENAEPMSPTTVSHTRAYPTDILPLRSSSSQDLTDDQYATSAGASVANEQRIRQPLALQARPASTSHITRVPYEKVTLASSMPVSQVSTTNTVLPPSSEAGEEQSPSSGREDATVTTLRDPEQGECPSSGTAPTSPHPKNSMESVTPRQRELWDMLLPESSQSPIQYPTQYTKPKTERKSFPDHFRSIFDSAGVLATGTQPWKRSSRPGRIIDRLQPFERELQGSAERSSGSGVLSDATLENSPVPLKDKQSDVLLSDDMFSSIAGQHQLLPGKGLRITYSTQRSHLANECSDDSASLDLLPPVDGTAQAVASAGKKPRKKAQMGDTASLEGSRTEIDCPQNNSMRTIHELRESGENVRQLNDLETLFDDMDASGPVPMSLRRSKLFELIRRLQEPTYCRLLLDQGYDRRLLAMSTLRGGDAMTEILYATAMLYLVAAPSTLRATFTTNDACIADMFAMRLTDDQDLKVIAQDRRSNISKSGQSDWKDCIDLILSSNIWRGGGPTTFSGRIIGLQGLDYLVRRSRETGCKTQIISPIIIERVIEVLPPSDEASPLHPSADHIFGTQLAVSILESCTISGIKFDDDDLWSVVTLTPILSVLPWLNCRALPSSEGLRRLTLRLYLNLTNNNPRLCQEFAGLKVIQSIVHVIESHFRVLSDPEQRVSSLAILDTLILALGTLINLVEWSLAVRHTIVSNADTGESFLAILVGLFLTRRKAAAEVYSEEETSSNVAFGYLSVLLAYLCIDAKARAVFMVRSGGEPLQQLLDAVEEFLQYHRQIDEVLESEEGETDLNASFIGRLEVVVAQLRDIG